MVWRCPLPLPRSAADGGEVAEVAHVSRRLVYRAVERGELVGFKLGARLRFEPDAVQAWIDGQRVHPVPARLLMVAEVAEVAHVSRRLVYRAVERGELVGFSSARGCGSSRTPCKRGSTVSACIRWRLRRLRRGGGSNLQPVGCAACSISSGMARRVTVTNQVPPRRGNVRGRGHKERGGSPCRQ
jgi:excisionase family DNA binding protein